MSYLFPPAPVNALRVQGLEDRFPLRRIYCVGQNYAEHAREMGADPQRQLPFFFRKPREAAFQQAPFSHPGGAAEVHHEVELVVALLAGGRDLSLEQARRCIFGYAVGLDLTRRDLQREARQVGRPWDVAKGFERSAPLGLLLPALEAGPLESGEISLRVNGEVRQLGDLRQRIWNVPEILVHLSRWFELAAGDLVFTGTPAGVGPVLPGERLLASIQGLPALELEVV